MIRSRWQPVAGTCNQDTAQSRTDPCETERAGARRSVEGTTGVSSLNESEHGLQLWFMVLYPFGAPSAQLAAAVSSSSERKSVGAGVQSRRQTYGAVSFTLCTPNVSSGVGSEADERRAAVSVTVSVQLRTVLRPTKAGAQVLGRSRRTGRPAYHGRPRQTLLRWVIC